MEKQKFQALLHMHAALGKIMGRPAPPSFFVFFFQTKCKSRETTGALIKRSSSDVPSCCLSEPHRHREGGSDLH